MCTKKKIPINIVDSYNSCYVRSPFIETLQSLKLNLFVDSNEIFISYLIEIEITSRAHLHLFCCHSLANLNGTTMVVDFAIIVIPVVKCPHFQIISFLRVT